MEKYKKFLRKMEGSENEVKDKDKDNQGEKKKGADHKIPDDFGIQLDASGPPSEEIHTVTWTCSSCRREFYSNEAYFAHISSCSG